MGYDRARDLEKFLVELEHRPGLTMRVRRPGFAGERSVRRAWPVLIDPNAGRDRQEPALALAAGALAGALIDWSLEWDGRPVPCTPRALMDLDTEFLLELVSVWIQRVVLHPAGQVQDPDAEPDPDADAGPSDVDGIDEDWLAQLPTVAPPSLDAIPDPAPLAKVDGAAEVDAEPEVVNA